MLKGFPSCKVAGWNALIEDMLKTGKANRCFEQMHHEGLPPNEVTYVCILEAGAVIRAIDKGRKFHDGAWCSSGHVSQGWHCFKDVISVQWAASQNAVSWSTPIAGNTQEGHTGQALEGMERGEILSNEVVKACIFKG